MVGRHPGGPPSLALTNTSNGVSTTVSDTSRAFFEV
jgi:hypothetical protein